MRVIEEWPSTTHIITRNRDGSSQNNQFVGCDLETGAFVLFVLAVMLVFGDSFLLTRTVFNLLRGGEQKLTFADVYLPLVPKHHRDVARGSAAAEPVDLEASESRDNSKSST